MVGYATTVMDNFWERHCDEVPDADSPAEKHNFSSKENHKFVEIDGNPEHSKRVCLDMQCPVLFVRKCLINIFICVQAMLVSGNAHGCNTFMYRLFCEEESEWTELITLATLMDSKPWWVVTPTQE